MAKPKVKRDIKNATLALKDIMRNYLMEISEVIIDQIMRNYNKLSPSNRINAIKDVSGGTLSYYKNDLLSACAIIAADAIENARKEVPSASKVKLSEWDEERLILGDFEKLPPVIKKMLKNQIDLMTATQKADLEKTIMFQFTSSVGSTDSEDTIRYDIYEAADDWINGNSVNAGADVLAAKTINESRNAFFFDDEVLEGIDAFQFKNDNPEVPICVDLNGTIFSADDPGWQRYSPPLHFNCRSYIIPILKGKLNGREVEPLTPSSSDLNKYVQFHKKDSCDCRVLISQIGD